MGSFHNNGGFHGYNGMHSRFNWFDRMFTDYFLIFIAFILILVILFVIFKRRKQKNFSTNKKQHFVVNEAEEIVKLRYARGEITQEELHSILQIIKS
ncbi:SHOCT domain-containing protein [Paraliobacillus sp. JSM ZJ581]|uniref:SHOCT domain-containing protein n=1 Tax=Paraliobacillus sp. JSM ZJ581 TaxID=3342118 RepID=UPI0035A84ECA